MPYASWQKLNAELRDDFGERYVVIIPKDRQKYYDSPVRCPRMATSFPGNLTVEPDRKEDDGS